MEDTVRWSLVVSKDIDITLRTHLARLGMKKGDLSKFVEDAVRWRVLDRTVADAKAANAGLPAAEIDDAVNEALKAVRAERFSK